MLITADAESKRLSQAAAAVANALRTEADVFRRQRLLVENKVRREGGAGQGRKATAGHAKEGRKGHSGRTGDGQPPGGGGEGRWVNKMWIE